MGLSIDEPPDPLEISDYLQAVKAANDVMPQGLALCSYDGLPLDMRLETVSDLLLMCIHGLQLEAMLFINPPKEK